jgi:hypothetical protein
LPCCLVGVTCPKTRLRLARQRRIRRVVPYVERNRQFNPNYVERDLNGERIASGFVESAVNQVVGKRMVKRQQMGGDSVEHIFCSRFEPAYSTKSGKTHSEAGTSVPSKSRCGGQQRGLPPESSAHRLGVIEWHRGNSSVSPDNPFYRQSRSNYCCCSANRKTNGLQSVLSSQSVPIC